MMTARAAARKAERTGAEMSRPEHPFTGEPVLVDRAEAREILSVTDATFARLCREGRFENMVCEGRHALYRSAELRAYRAQDKRRGGSLGSITNTKIEPKETAAETVTQSPQMAADAGESSARATMPPGPTCPGCGRPFHPRRHNARTCSLACKQRVWRMGRKEVA
jgi:hypothetical protein